MYLLPSQMQQFHKMYPWVQPLPTRVKNVLASALFEFHDVETLDPDVVRGKGREFWLRMPNCGWRSIEQLEAVVGRMPEREGA